MGKLCFHKSGHVWEMFNTWSVKCFSESEQINSARRLNSWPFKAVSAFFSSTSCARLTLFLLRPGKNGTLLSTKPPSRKKWHLAQHKTLIAEGSGKDTQYAEACTTLPLSSITGSRDPLCRKLNQHVKSCDHMTIGDMPSRFSMDSRAGKGKEGMNAQIPLCNEIQVHSVLSSSKWIMDLHPHEVVMCDQQGTVQRSNAFAGL